MSGANDENPQINNSPITIEDAFRRVQEGDQQAADTSVGDGDLGKSKEQSGHENISQESSTQSEKGLQHSEQFEGSDESNNDVGGSTDPIEESGGTPQVEETVEFIDYKSVCRAYIESTQKLAIDATNKLFRDNNVSKITINDLYEKDERGRVSFRNPDDPDRSFQSRAEAQQWCDAFNSQVDAEWRRTAQSFQQGYIKDIQPMLRLMDFAPEFDAMSSQEQKVFDNVVEDYAVKDKAGMVVGYSCDLRQAKQVALNICKSIGTQNEQLAPAGDPQEQISGDGPAVDAKTSSSGNPQNTNDAPKSVQEAMKMINEQKKKEKENGK